MTDHLVREPSADHPITITPTGRPVTVRVAGETVAHTDRALTLREAHLPAVQYLPLADFNPAMLNRTATTSYCPFKGEAVYYRVTTTAGAVDDVVWSYPQPHRAVAAIAGHAACYPDKAEISIG